MAILKAMATLFLLTLAATAAFEFTGSGTASRLTGSAMEGKEQRFGLVQSVFFANATTNTSTGAVNSAHDSYSALGGGALILTPLMGADGYFALINQTQSVGARYGLHPYRVRHLRHRRRRMSSRFQVTTSRRPGTRRMWAAASGRYRGRAARTSASAPFAHSSPWRTLTR